MKKSVILYITILVTGLTACNDWLDIRPESQTVLEDFWQSESQATQVLSACYSGMQQDNYMARMLFWGELRSDNLIAGNSPASDISRILNTNITPTNVYADWGAFYTVINYCNTFLHFAPGVLQKDQNFTPSKLHTLEAEARAIRALSYFYLLRAFRDVPLVTEPSISDDQNYYIAKSTERVVLDTIIADLKFAQKYARTTFGKGEYNKGRITLRAVNAILADVYLWDNQFDNCVAACNQVLNDNTLELVRGEKVINEVFYKGNSTESIFELQFDEKVRTNNIISQAYGVYGFFGVLNFPQQLTTAAGTFSPFIYPVGSTKESEKDLREYYSFASVANEYDGYSIYKYAAVDLEESSTGVYTPILRTSATTVNWVMYRLSDVILMKAEALAQLTLTNNSKTEILNLVNKTYLRSNPLADSLQVSNYSDKEALERLVLRERHRELLFEGKRWFDLMRFVRRKNDAKVMLSYISFKLTGNSMGVSKMSVMDALYMPVLKSQIDINPNLTQNPFYTDENMSN